MFFFPKVFSTKNEKNVFFCCSKAVKVMEVCVDKQCCFFSSEDWISWDCVNMVCDCVTSAIDDGGAR